MASNLRVDQILPSTSTNVAIGTATGSVTLVGSVSGTSITNSGVTTVAAGSASAPSITPTGDSNTGIFFPSADTIAFAEGGVESARFDSNRRLGIGTITPSFLTEIYSTSTNTYADNAGVNIGPLALRTINNSATAGQTATIRLISSDNGGNQNAVSVIANIQESSGSNNAALAFQVRGSDGVVERLRINSSGNIGINSTSPARKLDVVDSGASGSVIRSRVTTNNGGYLAYEALNSSGTSVFSVTHNGRINLSENIVFASGQGLDFSATSNSSGTMTSELLDDYEYGTWTPTLDGRTTNFSSVTYTERTGTYTKIGNLVTINAYIFVSAWSGASGEIRIGGIPFSVTGGSNPGYTVSVTSGGMNTHPVMAVSFDTALFEFYSYSNTGGFSNILDSQLTQDFYIRLNGSYRTS